MESQSVNGISVLCDGGDNGLLIYLKLFVLLYADDTVILSESDKDLQAALDTFENYCTQWRLTVNIAKSNVVVFSKGRPGRYEFYFSGRKLDVVTEYKYLGVKFSSSGSFLRRGSI